jgi:predicted restriction endonuclease
MPVRPCISCGILCNGTYCDRHVPTRKTPGRGSSRQAAFRRAVLANAGGQCQAIEHGERCSATTALEAHHLRLYRDSGSMDSADGVALCKAHHVLAEGVSLRLPSAA